MPPDAAPKTHLAAGPWCFDGLEDKFPDFDRRFSFCPEPLADPARLPDAARAAEALCVNVVPELARSLFADFAEFPPVYWRTLLDPWAIAVASQIVERSLRRRAMIDQYGDEKLAVPLAPADANFDFIDENDFYLRGTLGSAYNFWLFSRLLERDWPEKWQKIYNPLKITPAPRATPSLSGRLKNALRSLSLALPFPKLKGLSVPQAVIFSLALLRAPARPDRSLNLAELYPRSDQHPEFDPKDVAPLFIRSLPASLRSVGRAPVGPAKERRLRIASVRAYEDSAYRQKLALWRARGGRLGFVQHGGNYGQAKTVCNSRIVEYSQDVFFTWGWTKHGDARGNFLPMPYPGLARLADAWRGGGDIVFAGAEMALYAYRLESRPTPLQFLAYRRAKARFFTALGDDLTRQTLYRPYFSLPGTLADYPWLKKRFPGLRLCQGPLTPRLLACDLLILDHHGTIMLEALAAGVPMILYWDPALWPLVDEGEKARLLMRDAGIWHPNPESAARAAREIAGDSAAWRKETRSTYVKIRENLARLPKSDLTRLWFATLKNL